MKVRRVWLISSHSCERYKYKIVNTICDKRTWTYIEGNEVGKEILKELHVQKVIIRTFGLVFLIQLACSLVRITIIRPTQ